MRNRIKKATQSEERPVLKSFNSPSEAFNASLATHLIICEWAGENWRWYINFLEKKLQGKTGDALRAPVSRPSTPDPTNPPARRETAPQTVPKRVFSIPAGASQYISRVLSFKPNPNPNSQLNPKTKTPPPLLPTTNPNTNITANTQPQIPNPPPSPEVLLEEPSFSFRDLQHTQHIEEKANEASLVLKMNTNVLCEIKQYYNSLISSSDFPEELRKECAGSVASFTARVNAVIHGLEIQQSRLQTLLKLLGDKKTLVSASPFHAIFELEGIVFG